MGAETTKTAANELTWARLWKWIGILYVASLVGVLIKTSVQGLELQNMWQYVIHRSPIDTRRSRVKQLADYPWSSYPAYINKTRAPNWLSREPTYAMLGHRQRYVQ